MHKMLARSACSLIVFCAVSSSWSATYYVDPKDGLDSYNGQSLIHGSGSDGPFKTLQGALDVAVNPGDTVYLRGGVYRPNYVNSAVGRAVGFLKGSGSNINGELKYLTIAAWPGERPILKGSEVATGWEAHDLTGGKAIYKTRSWHPGDEFAFRYPQGAFVSTVEDYGAARDGTALKQIHWIDTHVAASGVLTLTAATNVADGDTVTLGSKTLTFRNTPSLEYDVQRHASDGAISLAELAVKINAKHPKVRAEITSPTTIRIYGEAAAGAPGNSIVTTETSSNLAFANGMLEGGKDGATGSASAKATLTTVSAANPASGDTVTIDGKTYTFRTALTPTEGEVLRGLTAKASLENLRDAINHTGTPNTGYKCAAPHASVRARNTVETAGAESTLIVASILIGSDGNTAAISETSALAWEGAPSTLSGGAELTYLNKGVKPAYATLKSNNIAPSAGHTVTIGSQTYTFRSSLVTEGDVLLNVSADVSLQNLVDAINRTGTSGTQYIAASPNADVTAGALDTVNHSFAVTAKNLGAAGNSVATTDTSATLEWSDTTLYGGARYGWEAPNSYVPRYRGAAGSLAAMTAGSFYYDNTEQVLYVWLPDNEDPANRVVEVSTCPWVWAYNSNIHGDYVHIKGLTFRHSNFTSGDNFGAALVTARHHSIIEDCDAQWGDFAGIGVNDWGLIVNCKANNNGNSGASGRDRTTIRNCQLNGNNYRNFASGWHAGGSKIAGANVLFEGCEVAFNNGAGIWADLDCGHLVSWDGHEAVLVRDCYIHHNHLGIFFEISQHCAAKNNIVTENLGAIAVNDSPYCTISNNTIAYNSTGVGNAHPYSQTVQFQNEGRRAMNDSTFTYNLMLENRAAFYLRLPANGQVTGGYPQSNNVCDYNVYEHSDPSTITVDGPSGPATSSSVLFTLVDGYYGPLTWAQWQKTPSGTNSGYDEHSIYGTPVNVNFAALGFAAAPGADLVAMQAKNYSAVAKAFSAMTTPGLTGYLGARPGFSQLQNTVTTATGNITTLQGNVSTLQTTVSTATGNISSLQTWQVEPTLGSGKDFIAGYSTGDPTTANLKGGFRYNTNSGQTDGRSWLLSGDTFNWGDSGWFFSSSSSTNPTVPRIYHDALQNRTSIGHNAATAPAGTQTLNVEGSLGITGTTNPNFVVGPMSGLTGTPGYKVYTVSGQSNSGTQTVELTLAGGGKIPIESGKSYLVTVSAVGRESGSGGHTAAFIRMATAENVGGTSELLNDSYDTPHYRRNNTNFNVVVDVDDTTDMLKITASGSSFTMNWAARVELWEVNQ